MPFHTVASIPGRPASAMVGTSGQHRETPRARDGERAQFSAADVRAERGEHAEAGVDVAGEQVGQVGAERLVGHLDDVDARPPP